MYEICILYIVSEFWPIGTQKNIYSGDGDRSEVSGRIGLGIGRTDEIEVENGR